MSLIEQALFTSAETHLATDYRIVARSQGLCEADARELAVWCPTHDAMIDPEGESINFHPLPSGAFCVSRTTTTGWDYGSQGGQRSMTRCLIVAPDVLARFANNPFALMRAAAAYDAAAGDHATSMALDAFSLGGGADAVVPTLLAELAQTIGPDTMAALVYLARNAVSLALADAPSPALLIEGLLTCLPLEYRTEFSFATGLKFSPRRPFRLVSLSTDMAERLWVADHPNVTIFALGHATPLRTIALDGWACLIERVLATGQTSFLVTQLSKHRHDLAADDLPALGLQLLEELDNRESYGDDQPVVEESCQMEAPRAHQAHRRFKKSCESHEAADRPAAAPSSLDAAASSPAALEQLANLDELVYEAISGDAIAMERLQTLWPVLLVELDDEVLGEAREQYLRYAITIWEDSVDANGLRDSTRAMQALDVLCLLFGDA